MAKVPNLCHHLVMTKRKLLVLVALCAILSALVPLSSTLTSAAPVAIVDIQLLNVSDWHGQLDPSGTPASGGASTIATYWNADRAANPNTITLTAGDDFGATPPLSGMFDEVPAVLAQRMMGIQVNTFGNHNFDRGVAHLQQMIELAGSPTSPLTPSSIYNNGIPFQYVAANLINTTGVLTGVAPYKIFEFQGVQVAVIGLVNEEAPSLVKPGNFGPIQITDSVAAAMAAKTQAEAEGADVFVAITHKGITAPNQGPLIDFANGVTGFDLILGDHTDLNFQNTINGALVTENKSKGLQYLKVNLTYDTTTETVTNKSATFVTPTANVPKVAAIEAMLAPYRAQLAQQFDTPIGVTHGFYTRGNNVERVAEVPLGNLVTDAIRAQYGTQIAFTNGGGLRDTLPSAYTPINRNLRRASVGYPTGPSYDLVLGDIYAVLPFGNTVVTRTVTGGQLWQAMEFGLGALPGANGRFPQISGFKVTFDSSKAIGQQIQSITLDNGTQVLSNTTSIYTLATNDFTNAGGDGYTMLNDGKGTTLEVMADVVLQYITENTPIMPSIENRLLDVTRISDIHDLMIPEDSTTGPMNFLISDPRLATDPNTTTVTLTATSLNTTLVPNANVVLAGSGVNRRVTVTPVAGRSGTVTIQIRVNGQGSASDTFVLVVNDKPTANSVASLTTDEDASVTIDIGVTDSDTSASDITITGFSDDQDLVADADIVETGATNAFTRTFTIAPVLNASGTTNLTFVVGDGVSAYTRTVALTVNAVNDAPELSAFMDETINVNSTLGPILFTVADIDDTAANLTVTAESSNTTLVPNANISIVGTGSERTLSLTPAVGQTGTTTITVTVDDGEDTFERTFVVTVVNNKLYLPLVGK